MGLCKAAWRRAEELRRCAAAAMCFSVVCWEMTRAVGYLLRTGVLGVDDILDAPDRGASRWAVLDPDVARQPFRDTSHTPGVLPGREREVIGPRAGPLGRCSCRRRRRGSSRTRTSTSSGWLRYSQHDWQ